MIDRFLRAAIALVLLPSLSRSAWAQTEGVVVRTTVEFNIGPIFQNNGNDLNGPDPKFSQVCRFKGSTYVVWVDGERHPWVTQITSGVVSSHLLDSGADFLAEPDGHCNFSLGIDKKGFLHVTGDMHNYDEWQTSAGSVPYPERYRGQRILYWQSVLPASVKGGFQFAGGLHATTAIPGRRWITGRFINDAGGELYYYSQCEAYHRAPNDPAAMPQGQYGIGLFRYNDATRTWNALGGLPDKVLPDGATYWKVLYWENSGYIAPYNWFDNYECTFQFDSHNRLHFAASVNTDTNIQGNNRLVYAYSDDGGNTWKKASGAPTPGLPLRGADGAANQADVVANHPPGIGPAFTGWTTVTADAQGHPAVHNGGDSGNKAGWFTFLNGQWSNTNSALNPNAGDADVGATGKDGFLYLTQISGPRLRWTKSVTEPATSYEFLGYDRIFGLDEAALRQEGSLYGIGLQNVNTPNVRATVLKTTITPAPLPAGWSSSDIGIATFTGNGGTSGYLNGQFMMNDYGAVVDNDADSMRYTAKACTGDVTIVARLASQKAASDLARAGLMIRASLASNAPNALVAITPGKNAVFSWRTTSGGGTQHPSVDGTAAPYWLKLVRSGDNFSGFVSPDGLKWTQVNATQTIVMPPTIFVGLAGSAYQNGYAMQSSTFDHVFVAQASRSIK